MGRLNRDKDDLCDEISVHISKREYIEALEKIDSGKVMYGEEFEDYFSRTEILILLRRQKELQKPLKFFKLNPIARFFQSVALRIDPPQLIRFDDENLFIKTVFNVYVSKWSDVELLHFKTWNRQTKFFSFVARIAYLKINGKNLKFDCSDYLGDFDFPQTFLNVLNKNGLLEDKWCE